jgi:hypothetical protein
MVDSVITPSILDDQPRIDLHDSSSKSGRRQIIRHDHVDAATSMRKGHA